MRRVAQVLVVFCVLASSVQAMEWQMLDDMRQAVQQQSYRGEYLHRRGDQSSAYSVVHRATESGSQELLRQLDGDMIEVLRRENEWVCYLPENSRGALNHAVPAAPFSQTEALDLTTIAQNYRAVTIGSERVAGYQATVVELEGDAWRYRQRLWLERETRLLLQSELISPDGRILEQFRFTRLELGVAIADAELVPTLKGQPGIIQQSLQVKARESISNDAFNSQIAWLPDGFELAFAQRTETASGWLEQRTFSDGLASVSVFVELGKSLEGQQSGLAKMGATTALMTFQEGLSISVVGEIPSETAKTIADRITLASSAI